MPVSEEQINTIIDISKKFGATKVLLFGSALDNPDEANDIDIGVLGIPKDRFLLFAGIIENILIRAVDVVPLEIDNPFTRYIIKKGKFIYEN